MGNSHSSAFASAYKQLGRTPQRVDKMCGVLCAEVNTIAKHILSFSASLADALATSVAPLGSVARTAPLAIARPAAHAAALARRMMMAPVPRDLTATIS